MFCWGIRYQEIPETHEYKSYDGGYIKSPVPTQSFDDDWKEGILKKSSEKSSEKYQPPEIIQVMTVPKAPPNKQLINFPFSSGGAHLDTRL